MMWPLRRSRDRQRTCLDCGETWTVDAAMVHMRPRRPRGGRLGVGYGARMQIPDLAGEAYAELDQQLDLIRATRTCPKCGSDHYRDARVRRPAGG